MTISERNPRTGWWFGGEELPHGDGRPVTPGCVFRVPPPIKLCSRGLHMAQHALQAMEWAHGCKVWRVEGWGECASDAFKCVCEYRRHLWQLDAENILRRFACRCALDVLPSDVSDVVRTYLKLADRATDGQRIAAWDAAWSAARSAAWDAAWSAARDAARDAAWAAAGDAARDAAWAAAWDAARAAAWDAVGEAVGFAAWDAAWAAARIRYERRLDSMLYAEAKKLGTPNTEAGE